MSITHSLFLPLPIRNNLPVTDDPEIKHIDIQVTSSYSCNPEVVKNKIMGRDYVKLVLVWAYYIDSKATSKELLYFGGKDNFDVKQPVSTSFDYPSLIRDSNQRFIDYYDNLNLVDELEPLDEISIAQIHSEIKSCLGV